MTHLPSLQRRSSTRRPSRRRLRLPGSPSSTNATSWSDRSSPSSISAASTGVAGIVGECGVELIAVELPALLVDVDDGITTKAPSPGTSRVRCPMRSPMWSNPCVMSSRD